MRFKQRMFCLEYIRDFNATQSALRAGYSPRSAYSIGQENLRKPEIAAEIQRLIEERIMSAEEVKLRLADHARGDIQDFLDVESMGFQLDLEKGLQLGKTHLIKKLKQTVTTTTRGVGDNQTEEERIFTEIELHDAQAALDKLAKILSLYTENINVKAGLTVEGVEKMIKDVYPDDPDTA